MCSCSEYEQVMDVNVNGVLFTAQAAARQMARFGNGGSIVMIASICGRVAMEVRLLARLSSACLADRTIHQPPICTIPYQASKAAVLQMARTMACELASQRIRVNTISPGFVTTKCVPLLSSTY